MHQFGRKACERWKAASRDRGKVDSIFHPCVEQQALSFVVSSGAMYLKVAIFPKEDGEAEGQLNDVPMTLLF